jgi:hypothetical protein
VRKKSRIREDDVVYASGRHRRRLDMGLQINDSKGVLRVIMNEDQGSARDDGGDRVVLFEGLCPHSSKRHRGQREDALRAEQTLHDRPRFNDGAALQGIRRKAMQRANFLEEKLNKGARLTERMERRTCLS